MIPDPAREAGLRRGWGKGFYAIELRRRGYTMAENVKARLLVSGRVQGVAFRWETLQAAQRCQVNGWVRNLADGRVEAVIEGSRQQVNDLIDWCRHGPPIARVDHLDIQWEEYSGSYAGFEIRH